MLRIITDGAADMPEGWGEEYDIRDSIMTDLSISVAANLGPGTVGLVVYPVGE
ncbi:MAG: hypothetical protein QMD04_14505 [Anaerolineales bacterium]|nr:hypothetical protein [Anaerolineales bacterium]